MTNDLISHLVAQQTSIYPNFSPLPPPLPILSPPHLLELEPGQIVSTIPPPLTGNKRGRESPNKSDSPRKRSREELCRIDQLAPYKLKELIRDHITLASMPKQSQLTDYLDEEIKRISSNKHLFSTKLPNVIVDQAQQQNWLFCAPRINDKIPPLPQHARCDVCGRALTGNVCVIYSKTNQFCGYSDLSCAKRYNSLKVMFSVVKRLLDLQKLVWDAEDVRSIVDHLARYIKDKTLSVIGFLENALHEETVINSRS